MVTSKVVSLLVISKDRERIEWGWYDAASEEAANMSGTNVVVALCCWLWLSAGLVELEAKVVVTVIVMVN